MQTKISSNEDMAAMLSALKVSAVFDIQKDSETCVVKHRASGKEVLRSLRSPAGWVTRHHSQLFA